jgi:hypothetical protein
MVTQNEMALDGAGMALGSSQHATRPGPDDDGHGSDAPYKGDHVREFRVVGPPGCGKTEYLTRQCRHAAERFGAGKVVVCSLTRAAAAEVAARAEGIPRENIGTLHALALRSMGGGFRVAESQTTAWNEHCREHGRPWYQLSVDAPPDADDVVDPQLEQTEGDTLLGEMGRLRSRLTPRAAWPAPLLPFAECWDAWKRDAGVIDFTDMLEAALRDAETAPGDPAAVLVDEAQDLSRLSWALARKWGERALTFVTVGDPDQCLYSWAGVDVEAFSAVPLPPEQQRTLKQSYRVPAAVHALATRWIGDTPRRLPVEYFPRDCAGAVRQIEATVAQPEPAIEDALVQLERGRTVLFATSCGYQLGRIIAELRQAGIPFHNPYRVKRGDWNPLRRCRGTSAADRIVAFARPSMVTPDGYHPWWTVRDLHAWVEWLETAKALTKGAKAKVDRWYDADPDRLVDVQECLSLIPPQFHDRTVVEQDLDWLVEHTLPRHRRQLFYPLRVARRFGVLELTRPPRVVVSTIHGCKGGQADVVYLFPDLSPRAAEEWDEPDGGEGKEGIRRAFYVGFTRAREELVLCEAASPLAVGFN